MTGEIKTDPDAPYGRRKDGTPMKRRGKPKGSVKTGGRRTKPAPVRVEMNPQETRQWFLPRWAQAIADIIEGKELEFAHRTGKRIKRIRTSEEFMNALNQIKDKVLPSQHASAVKAEFEQVVDNDEPTDTRQLARVILGVLGEAVPKDEPPPPPPPQPMKLIGRDEIIETSFAGQPVTERAEPAAPSIELPAVGGVAEGVGHSPTSPTASLVSSSSQEPRGDTDASGVALSHGASIRNEIRADNRIDPPVHRPKVHRRRPR